MRISIGIGDMRLETLASLMGGVTVYSGKSELTTVNSICTDSREVHTGTLFCAIRGERVDGHRFMATAHRAGCHTYLCERIPEDLPAPFAAIIVEDTVEALCRMAAGYRAAYHADLLTVGITGSVGKTTTKECVASVLSSGHRVYKKDGNYNSTIGLPLSMMEIAEAPDVAVLEMGMSGLGEIHAMSMAAKPRVGMITNIGSSHLELLGSRENIARAKMEILDGMERGSTLLINGDEPLLTVPLGRGVNGVDVLRVSLTDPTADFYARATGIREGGMVFDLSTPAGEWRELFIPALGDHMVWAGAYAVASGILTGMNETAIRRGLSEYIPAAMRQSIRRAGDVTLIEDCYNAAPESMRAALSVLRAQAKGRRIAVLGDMRELGTSSVSLHRAVGADFAHAQIDMLITVGTLGAEIARGAADAGLVGENIRIIGDASTYPEAAEWLRSMLMPGDTVLFKASRAMRLEEISGALARSMMQAG